MRGARPAVIAALLALASVAAQAAPAPVPRPAPEADAPAVVEQEPEQETGVRAPRLAPIPAPRGSASARPAAPARPSPVGPGPICGDPRLVGREVAPIEGTGGCGVAEPVRVLEVAGVALTAPARMNCTTARALANWVETGAKPSATRVFGTSLASFRPAAGYACRTRNSRKGAKLSQHATGNAIDISAFTLADGRTFTVLEDWRAIGAKRRFMRALWSSACASFGTVLGPDSDRHHRDHFHFDTAAYRSGPYCR